MFDSPIARCEIIEEMVLIDETQAECAREHGCPPDRVCPLARYFAEPPAAVLTVRKRGNGAIPALT
jgi:hypothetical protein